MTGKIPGVLQRKEISRNLIETNQQKDHTNPFPTNWGFVQENQDVDWWEYIRNKLCRFIAVKPYCIGEAYFPFRHDIRHAWAYLLIHSARRALISEISPIATKQDWGHRGREIWNFKLGLDTNPTQILNSLYFHIE